MIGTNNILFLIILIITKIQVGNNSEDIYETEIIKNKILYDYKKGSGAYYIVYSPFRDDYNRITSYVRLPTFIETNEGKRDGFISFGIQGQYGYIDMGIMNSGKGWKPYYNDNGDLISYDDFISFEDVKYIALDIEIYSKKNVKFSISFRDSNKEIINDKRFSTTLYCSHIFEGNLEEKPNLRFYRFVALVNNKDKGVPDNQKDNTALINATFADLVIMINNEGKTWGINGPNIEASWKVSPKKIEFSCGVDFDNFSIIYYD